MVTKPYEFLRYRLGYRRTTILIFRDAIHKTPSLSQFAYRSEGQGKVSSAYGFGIKTTRANQGILEKSDTKIVCSSQVGELHNGLGEGSIQITEKMDQHLSGCTRTGTD
jgi:hypothetical protein